MKPKDLLSLRSIISTFSADPYKISLLESRMTRKPSIYLLGIPVAVIQKCLGLLVKENLNDS